ncbi:hypothetical protein UPYG_G00275830 [Umbra pygmaea]|uniref:Opsin-5 n=1 Tax=Umbra pygmaea TaxID=75934 RepID=A0ABD0W276_UMBPY
MNSSVRTGYEGNRTSSIFSSKLAPGADICVGFTILLLALLSILGNGLVLLISYRRRKKMVCSELLCVNLALVDFLCCICFYPLSILSSFNHAWLGNHITCTYYGLGCYIFGLCGMFTIASISVIRYLKTCYSMVYAVWLDGANIRLVCCAIWLVAAVWSCFPLFGWGEYVPEPYGLSCTVAWHSYHTSFKDAFYVICSFAFFMLVPILLILVSQIQVLFQVYRFTHTLTARGIHTTLRNSERRLSVMFFCISFGFVIAWTPYAVVSFLFIFHKGNWYMAPSGFVIPTLFAKSSHVYNPFIYFYFNKAFRQELRSLLQVFCHRPARNCVGDCPALDQGPHAIQIQLQEQVPCLLEANSQRNIRGQRSVTNAHMQRVSCWVSKDSVIPSAGENSSVS